MMQTRRAAWLAALATLLTAAPLVVPAASAETAGVSCAEPVPGQPLPRANPEDVQLDSAALNDALDFGARTGGVALQVYRHGCLVGDRTPTGNLPMPLASATKGVAATVVGRAITLGYFGLDDPLGKFFPQADAAHAELTVRQVLTQTTGLHFSWPADIAGLYTDSVLQTLAEPADYAPGTTYQYAQNVIAVLSKIIELSTGSDFQDFAQRELFAPLGIDRDNWIWLRDRSGNTAVNGGLAMRPDDLAKLGRLMLQQGQWGDSWLLDPDYIRQATTGTTANPGYGFLTWLNSGDTYLGTEFPTAITHPHPQFPGSPRDMYAFQGALGQFMTVVPSRDMVIIRMGIPLRIDPTNPAAILSGAGNPDNKELYHRITAAVTDLPAEPYVDPYTLPSSPAPVRSLDDLAKLVDPVNTATILLGVGPYASTACNILWCNGKPVPVDVFRLILDIGAQAANALLALGNTPR
ncbi:serine hydrolase domain-containing protein [Nocardia huaxiensis]|uniref:Beta-lactamase family protein n=1 Tax=Nocardia huaxiensis TaxID=2755382 RepID=A0A7D6ZAR7_9NOCA|nr:serine hydrolase domain-containing protein [Nocardia huaxiensis]QLY29218.1 beta-lactamase family protein [Nocardia huaxiensis]UFS97281.1 beta-lactamase family protein [Nocardia huaxiensis]